MSFNEPVWRRQGREFPSPPLESLTTLADAKLAIERLMDAGGHLPGNKAEFAEFMGWVTAKGLPDRRRVERMCNLTRDQDCFPWVADSLAGYVVAYSPNKGGLTLIAADGELDATALVHVLSGDLQRQTQTKTQNRRRQPAWRELADQMQRLGNSDLARVSWTAEDQINRTGYVSDDTVAQFMRAVLALGLAES